MKLRDLIRSYNFQNTPAIMKKTIFIIYLLFQFIGILAQNPASGDEKKIKFYDQRYFLIEGTTFTDSVKENLYDRFPASYKGKVREEVWELSKCSAGITIRFSSNSTVLRVKWELLNDLKMNHMAETGIKGVDLYFKNENGWQYVNTARPSGKINDFLVVSNMTPELREYKMYLPLYDGVTKLEVGIDSLSKIIMPVRNHNKPIVFYGTSITQGGCASRTGMVHTSIISRKLGVECINFGFSGNGKMEKPVVELISGIDALFYVIECTENMTPEEINDSSAPLVEIIRKKHPSTPIVFVNNLLYEKSSLDEETLKSIDLKNEMCKRVFKTMTNAGYKNIYFIDKEGSIGKDHEATVDGVHLTDLGFLRYADYLIGKFRMFGLPLN
jgi:hypothetical protein